MDKADLEDRVKMLEQQLSAQIDTMNLIVRRNEVRIQELKVACTDAVASNEISLVAAVKLEELLKGVTVVTAPARKHSHYYKDVSHLKDIDVDRVLKLFNVTDPCVQHAVKKLLVAGGRGAGKDIERDLREAVDSINRALQMIAEDDV